MQLKSKEGFVQCVEKVLWLIECVEGGLRRFMLAISHQTTLHGRVEQLKSKAIKLRHSLRTVNILWRGRQLTKYPNQYSYWWKWKMSFILQKRLNGLLDQPNTRIWILSYSLLWGSNVADCHTDINIFCL